MREKLVTVARQSRWERPDKKVAAVSVLSPIGAWARRLVIVQSTLALIVARGGRNWKRARPRLQRGDATLGVGGGGGGGSAQ